jgi:hypothetical protein
MRRRSATRCGRLDYSLHLKRLSDSTTVRMLPHGFGRAYGLEAFGAADFSMAREPLGAYPNLSGFGIADVSEVVLAARYDATDILTTAQRDFREVELPGGRHFRILPYDR